MELSRKIIVNLWQSLTCVGHLSKILKRAPDLPLLKHDFLMTAVGGYFHKWLLNKIRWFLPSNKNYVLTNIIRMLTTSKMELFETIVNSELLLEKLCF